MFRRDYPGVHNHFFGGQFREFVSNVDARLRFTPYADVVALSECGHDCSGLTLFEEALGDCDSC